MGGNFGGYDLTPLLEFNITEINSFSEILQFFYY